MELFYSIQELVEFAISIQISKYPNNRQGFEYRSQKRKLGLPVKRSHWT